jgi:hypothetical protein
VDHRTGGACPARRPALELRAAVPRTNTYQ